MRRSASSGGLAGNGLRRSAARRRTGRRRRLHLRQGLHRLRGNFCRRGSCCRRRSHRDAYPLLRRQRTRPVGRSDLQGKRMIARGKRLLQDRAPLTLSIGRGRGHRGAAVLDADLPARRGAACDHALAIGLDHHHIEARHCRGFGLRLNGAGSIRLFLRRGRRLRESGSLRLRRLRRLGRQGGAGRISPAIGAKPAPLLIEVDCARADQEANTCRDNDGDRLSAAHPSFLGRRFCDALHG